MSTSPHCLFPQVALSALLAAATCEEAKVIAAPLAYAGYPYAGYPYAAAPYAAYAPYSAGSQFHAQVRILL